MLNTITEIRSGVPLKQDYKNLRKSAFFLEMEAFSDNFTAENAVYLESYARAWVPDPFHQWSRQWEYPFVGSRIGLISGRGPVRVLDAGSGMTFFPFYICERARDVSVDCCDNDPSLQRIYEEVSSARRNKVTFTVADLSALPFRNEEFDLVYCISVLEHTAAYEMIVREFLRVLRPGGKLVLTFDISIDGRSDIPVLQAAELVELLATEFRCSMATVPDVRSEVLRDAVVTTRSAEVFGRATVPWASPGFVDNFVSLIRTGRFKTLPYLTFCCLELTKPWLRT